MTESTSKPSLPAISLLEADVEKHISLLEPAEIKLYRKRRDLLTHLFHKFTTRGRVQWLRTRLQFLRAHGENYHSAIVAIFKELIEEPGCGVLLTGTTLQSLPPKRRFWDVKRADIANNLIIVQRSWGRLGTAGRTSTDIISTSKLADAFIANCIFRMKGRGYVEVSPSSPGEPTTSSPLERARVSLPIDWDEISEDMLPTEIFVYTKHDDVRTKERRDALCRRFRTLLGMPSEEKVLRLRQAAWIILRTTYMKYLSSIHIYPPATQDAAQSAMRELAFLLECLSLEQKKFLDERLGSLDGPTLPNLKNVEKQVAMFLDTLTEAIEREESIGYGGVSRARARTVAMTYQENLDDDFE